MRAGERREAAVQEFELLFEPIRIGALKIPNRFVFPATGTHFCQKDGTVSDRLINFLVRRAEGGAGLIVVEYTEIDPEQLASSRAVQIHHDRFIPGLSRLAKAVKAAGAAVAIQLHHPGRYSDHRISGRQAVAPSAMKSRILRETPRELTEEEIRDLVVKFAEGARRAREAGFDAVELHGASGYLLNQFFSPATNLRADAWGGDIARRCRFGKEIVARAKERAGRDFPLILRLAVKDFIPGGLEVAESKEIVRIMEAAGVDAVSVTAGGHDSVPHSSGQIVPGMFFPPGAYAGLAKEIKDVAQRPVLVAGRINTPRLAASILAEKKADMICMCRALICDPDLPNKARQGRSKEIRRCLYDNTCTDTIIRGVPGAALVCLLNPEVGREYVPEPGAEPAKRVLVLGGSPAGLEAARVARQRGHTVALFEENAALCGRWSWMIDPYVSNRRRVLEALGVEIRLGIAFLPKAVQAWAPEVVIATRGLKEPALLIPGMEEIKRAGADEVFSGKARPQGKVVVLGGNNIGLEAAELLAKAGCGVTIVEEDWPGRGIAAIMRAHYFARLSARAVKLLARAKITKVEKGAVVIRQADGGEQVIEAGWLVIALFKDIDLAPLGWLEELSAEVFYVNPTQSPREWTTAMLEGTELARRI